MVQIRNRNELVSYLRKGLEIERGFESLAQWESYVEAKNDSFRSMVFTMISESEGHAILVEEMLSRLQADGISQYPMRKQLFDFSTKEEQEMLLELARTEKLALDTYSNIRKGLLVADASWLPSSDYDFILRGLDRLIADETDHVQMASRNVGKVERIR